ncbi:MAG: hypothetical protein QY323_06040 [Patescibacteria group bacterium]|nr:MAG: hypothetical protein QY323_06040 [Patescibacteria group bacterium]
MSISKPPEHVFPSSEARERLFQVSATDLADGKLLLAQAYGRWPVVKPTFCDVWAAAKIDGTLYGDFCVDAGNIPDEARFMALRKLLGDSAAEVPERDSLLRAMLEEPDTLLLAMWGENANGEAFLALFHHPSFTETEAKSWLVTMLGRGIVRTGSES